jgi:hypothetical protein
MQLSQYGIGAAHFVIKEEMEQAAITKEIAFWTAMQYFIIEGHPS